jgi:hypothetical protein
MPKADSIKDRGTIKDLVMDWMHDNARSYSIDTLLTWPDMAKRMGVDICRKLRRKATAEAVHEVCRAALQSRKRGDLKLDRH